MSTFDNPFDPARRLTLSGCSCGRHGSEAEHESRAVELRLRTGRRLKKIATRAWSPPR